MKLLGEGKVLLNSVFSFGKFHISFYFIVSFYRIFYVNVIYWPTTRPDMLLYTHLPYHNDSIIVKTDAHRKMHEERKQEGRRKKTSLEKYSPLTLLQGFERVVQGLHVRGYWRPNMNFIFWPHCYDRHVVSFLFSWCWGPLHRGFSEGPLGRVWPSLPHLVSGCLEFYWQLLWHPKLNWVK